MTSILALSWFEHRRMTELCAGLELELVVLNTRFKGAARYLVLTQRTIALLARRRPDILMVQNPSLVLAAVSIVAGWIFGYHLVVDAHNEAVVPFVNKQKWVSRVSGWILRRADLTIVTNRPLAEVVEEKGGRPFILPDRIPAPPLGAARELAGDFNVVLIATFALDEPLVSIFEAVRDTQIDLYVTGNDSKLERSLAANVPANVRFTGYLAEADYWGLLRAADAIVDLTLMPNCLVCGAYEALALGKPMVLSGNPASVALFGGVALFTDNTTPDIRRALHQVRLERMQLQAAAVKRRHELKNEWVTQAKELATAMAALRQHAG